jgi:hypothetical protein
MNSRPESDRATTTRSHLGSESNGAKKHRPCHGTYHVTINMPQIHCAINFSVHQPCMMPTFFLEDLLPLFFSFWNHCHACLLMDSMDGDPKSRATTVRNPSLHVSDCRCRFHPGFYPYPHLWSNIFSFCTMDNRHYRRHLGPQFHIEDDILGLGDLCLGDLSKQTTSLGMPKHICMPIAQEFLASAHSTHGPVVVFFHARWVAVAVCKDQLALSALCYLVQVVTHGVHPKSKSINRWRKD